ncbi:MAG TPA: hypothetical protein VF171_02900 [Trueperaceae bacterium]
MAETAQPRTSYTLARGVLSLAGAGLGYLAALLLADRDALGATINMAYLTVLGLLLGYLLSAPLARRFEGFWHRVRARVAAIPPDAVLAAGVGAIAALVFTVLLNTQLQRVPGFTWYFSLLFTACLVTASAWFMVVNRQWILSRRHGASAPVAPLFEPAMPAKIIDTSAIIDGRILDVIEANFLEGALLIPHFVLLEVQGIADSDDPLRRKRGRRGLEVLDALVRHANISTRVIDDDAEATAVDEKLVRVCQRRHAHLITTDYNLSRVAALQGVRVLNLNQLANAVRAVFLPGETLSLHIVKEGRELGQGLAYLEDGTMIVVEDAAQLVGQTVEATVTSHLQTNMGRMIFARVQGNSN